MRNYLLQLVCVLMVGGAGAQTANNLIFLETGGESPLLTAFTNAPAASVTPGSQLHLRFGFATDEQPLPNQFLDSFTLTLQDPIAQISATLFTIDAAGLLKLPPTPGQLELDPISLRFDVIPFPNLSSAPTNQWAYDLTLDVPEEFWGNDFELYFDLFDNQDAIASLGWFSDVTVIPEPGAGLWLLAVGFGLWSFGRTKRRKQR